MKSNSTVYPNKFHKSQDKIFINDLSNVTEEVKDDITMYTYDTYELPIVDRDTLEEYINDNHEVLVKFALEKAKAIEATPINSDMDKARQEETMINLLVDLGVI